MIRFLSKIRDRRRARRDLSEARARYSKAFWAYFNASKRRDTRDMGRFVPELRASARAVLAAENALFKPAPLPRPIQASKANRSAA